MPPVLQHAMFDPAALLQTTNGSVEEKPITQRALLVRLQVSHWGEHAVDRTATEEIARSHQVAPGLGRYTKRLLNKDATQQVRSLGREARTIHNSLTIPWDDRGTRLLPIEAYEKYTSRIDELIEARRDAVNTLIHNFDEHVNRARINLGNLFDQDEYPSPDELRQAFDMNTEFEPVPDSNRFIAGIPDEEREKIKQAIEQRIAARVQAGVEDICQRLAKVVQVARQQLQETGEDQPTPRIYDSMVENLREIADNIPLINITDDPRLKAAAQRLHTATADLSADHLRPKNPHFDAARRQNFKNAVDDLATQFAGYF